MKKEFNIRRVRPMKQKQRIETLEIDVRFLSLKKEKVCQHLCSGAWYRNIPCTKIAVVAMDTRELCTLHIGIEICELLGLKRKTTWKNSFYDKATGGSGIRESSPVANVA